MGTAKVKPRKKDTKTKKANQNGRRQTFANRVDSEEKPASLQRRSGNKGALAQLLRQSENTRDTPTKSGQVIQKQEIGMTVSQQRSDAPYGWTSSYGLEVNASEVRITVHARTIPDAGVSAADVRRVQQQTRREFQRYFDRRFNFVDDAGNSRELLVDVVFVDSGEELTINLHAGSGRNDLSNWYVDSSPTPRAHELGHQIGLLDEYVDASAPNRATATSPGVFTDNSIMGNYYTEGRRDADVRERHGEQLAADVSSATGMSFTSEWSNNYIVRRGDNLSWIARRIYGNESRWRDIYDLNRDKIRNPNLIFPGQSLRLPPR